MNKPIKFLSARAASLACCFGLVTGACGATLLDFQFNEGSGFEVLDTAQNQVGYFGTSRFDPAVDTVSLVDDSPSGQSGDRAFANNGKGFLIGDTGADQVLNITNGPITMESWLKINGSVLPGVNEGIASYGGSYKFGFKNGILVFTLLGKADITNTFIPVLPVDQWIHVATAWDPGVGVNFHVTTDSGGGNFVTTSTFVANTNTTARALQNTYLSVGNEGFGNPLVASYDRFRIHQALLAPTDLDVDPLNSKAPFASTKVVYHFNESNLPALNSLTPNLPLAQGNSLAAATFGPAWTNDAPSGLPGDHALAFNLDVPANRQRINVDYSPGLVDLRANNTNYTLEAWVKLPEVMPTTRMVLFRTAEQSSAPTFRVSLSITPARALQTTVYGVTDFIGTAALVPNDGQWHHVAAVMVNYAQVRFYIDGVFKQSLNRTSANAPTGTGSSPTHNLLMGLESDALYFKGFLDRVRISNQALTNGELDAAKIIGTPYISSQPANVTVTVQGNASFSATAGGSGTLSYQWLFAPAGNPASKSNVPGGNSPTLNLTNVQPAQDGWYSLLVSNANGSTESTQARLVVSTAPLISAQPTNVTTVVTSSATFTVAAAPAPGYASLSYQWRYAPPANPTNKVAIAGANAASFTLNDLQLTNQGFYSVIVSNEGGSIESADARLIATVPGTLQPLWNIRPTDGREYITGYNSDANLRDLERGMGYNPITDHLLIGARFTSPLAKGIFIVDAQTGAHIGSLKSVTNTVTGGTIVLTRVVVADDGAIYACNFGTLSDANPLKIYRWANENAEPTVAYQGNPVSGIAANQQWGKNMTVRGSGTNTQILMDTRNIYHALFTTTDGATFTPTVFLPNATTDESGFGLVWGTNGTFWSKSSGRPLIQWQLNSPYTNAPLVRSFTGNGFPSSGFQNFSFSEDNRYMAGIVVQTGADAVELYDVSDLDRGPLLVDTGLFPVDNTQGVNYGNVFVTKNRVIALNPNNGIVAFALPSTDPEIGVRRTGSNLTIFWAASHSGYLLEGSDSLTTPNWTVIPHTTVGAENQATVTTSGASKFYRLKK